MNTHTPQSVDPSELENRVIETLRTVYDPEIPVDIYNLGLIYAVSADEEGKVYVEMTLTAPNCPVAGSLPAEVEQKLRALPGVSDVRVELTFDPPWSKDFISEEGKLMLGLL
ncbi:MAG: SUF system Fe-S cluster assembly protein [Chlorobi bacterium]|nr:SUF system Fe-S cluster assembly protein [Chlorobiota bacterium]